MQSWDSAEAVLVAEAVVEDEELHAATVAEVTAASASRASSLAVRRRAGGVEVRTVAFAPFREISGLMNMGRQPNSVLPTQSPVPVAPGGIAKTALAVCVVNWASASYSAIFVNIGTKAVRGSFW